MKLNNFYSKMNWAPADEGAPAPADPVQTPDPAPVEPVVDAGPDLSFIGADFQNEGKPDLEKFRSHYEELVARDAQNAERAAGVPEDGKYDLTLGEIDYGDIPLPEGFAVQLDLENEAYQPLVGDLTAWMRENGVPQSQAQGLTSILAKYEAAKFSQVYAKGVEELASLGTQSQIDARLARVTHTLGAKLPPAQAEALKDAVKTADGIRALEALLSPRGMTTPTPEPKTIDVEGMTPLDRLKHFNNASAQTVRRQ